MPLVRMLVRFGQSNTCNAKVVGEPYTVVNTANDSEFILSLMDRPFINVAWKGLDKWRPSSYLHDDKVLTSTY